MTVAEITLHESLRQVLHARGIQTADAVEQFLQPSFSAPTFVFPDLAKAVDRLRIAIEKEDPVAIYADRDVDGLSGLAILARSLKTLGAKVQWGSPLKGRGLERAVLESLVRTGARVMVLVDCGTAETEELNWLADQGLDVIVADHHRMLAERPKAFAWIHPEASASGEGNPCGAVMAFKLAEALWRTYIDPSDPERLDYFLYSHLDLVALGILADRVPLVGENRALVWHGLRRLATTTKTGLSSLMRFFRIKGNPVTVRQAAWQIIPLLNAAGRLREPQWAVQLLLTEDAWAAREAIDALLGLNTARRKAQEESVGFFEKTVLEQCVVDQDMVLVATAGNLEPSVTGLAAQALVQKYGKPVFLFVEQGDDFVGSGRGTAEIDLFSWVEAHQDLLLKFGGHKGAVGLTVRKSDFFLLRTGLLKMAEQKNAKVTSKIRHAECAIDLDVAGAEWWDHLRTLEPFGDGFEMPAFELLNVEGVLPRSKRSTTKVMLRRAGFSWPAELPEGGVIPKRFIALPHATPKEEFPFIWHIQPE
jgi:single-stranded-DNA-specific exonuclease